MSTASSGRWKPLPLLACMTGGRMIDPAPGDGSPDSCGAVEPVGALSTRRLLPTKGYKQRRDLTITQQNAIDLLVGGMIDKEVAAALGIHRVTVTKWRLYHPEFQATLNARRAALWESAQDRFRTLALAALDAIAADLASPSPERGKLALRVVELSRLSSADLSWAGPTDPDSVVDEAIEVQERRELQRHASDADRQQMRHELLARASEPPGPEEDPGADS